MKYGNSVEKQTIEYTHTIVPSSMRSPYWKYFGFPSDSSNKILTRQKIICTLCGTAITYNKNTSNLRTHLISRHPERLHEMHQQQRQHGTQFPSGCSVDCGDSDSTSTDVLNETEVEEESKIITQTCKRANTNNANVCNVLKIKRLSAGYGGTNKISTSNEQVSHFQPEDVGCDEQTCQTQQINVAIVANETAYEFLTSDTATASSTNAGEGDLNCTNDFNIETIHNEEDEFVENEAIILESEIKQKSEFDFSRNSSPCPNNQERKSNILNKNVCPIDLFSDMLVTDLLSVHVLKGVGFKNLFSSLGITNLDQFEIEKKILGDYSQMQCFLKKYIVTNLLQQDKPYSLSIEIYENCDRQSIFSIYVNFHFEDKFESILLEHIVCTEETDLRNILPDFDLSRCAAIVVTSPTNSMINDFAAEHGIEVVPCLDSLLTKCLNSIFEQDVISDMFHRIFKLNQNSNKTELCLQCPWSKLKYLQNFLDNSISTDMQDHEVSSDLEPFMAYINPLKITFDTINSEPLPLCTLVRPLIMKLFEEHFLVFNTEGNVYLQSAQNVINAELRKSITKCSFFSEAVLFDARFQHDFVQSRRNPDNQLYATLDSVQRLDLVAAVCQRFHRLIQTSDLSIKVEKSQQTTPKSSLRSFFRLISDAKGAANRKNGNNLLSKLPEPENAVDLEFSRYKCEPTLDLEQCPISWWQMQAQQYKQLHRIAHYYLSVPCCALRWPQNICETELNDRGVWWQKRRSLTLQHPVEKCLWYLHYNGALYDKIKHKRLLIARKNQNE